MRTRRRIGKGGEGRQGGLQQTQDRWGTTKAIVYHGLNEKYV